MSYIMTCSSFKQAKQPNRTLKPCYKITFINVLAIEKHFPHLDTARMIRYCYTHLFLLQK